MSYRSSMLLAAMVAGGLLMNSVSAAQAAEVQRVYFGTYTRNTDSKGIYVADVDVAAGKLANVRVAAECDNPSFLAIHPNGQWLYAACEVADFKGAKAGAVAAFQIDVETGALKLLNHQSTRGGAPCHLVVDKSGQCVLSANYGGGSVCVHPIGSEGKLDEISSFVQHQGHGTDPRRQEAPHAHSINVDPANEFAFVADLGLDQVVSYRFYPEEGKLAANPMGTARVEAGGGPRHFAFRPDGQFAYVCNEMHSTVTALRYDAPRGALTPIGTLSTLPKDASAEGNSTAECLVHPSGRFVYVSNRGHDSIAIFAVDEATGKLTHVGNEATQGKTPRNFALHPSGDLLLAENQGSHSVVAFRVDSKTGKLTATGSTLEVPSPVCARFWPPSQ